MLENAVSRDAKAFALPRILWRDLSNALVLQPNFRQSLWLGSTMSERIGNFF